MQGFVSKTLIKADSQGNIPTSINLLKAGTWNTPWHGDFELTSEDLNEMVAHFDAGVGLVDESDKQAPVNYGHMMGDKAAAWMKRLYVDVVNGTAGLFADVEWTPAAVQAIKDGEWKYISPEFNPRGYPWEDPEQEFTFVDNVLTGAALTNIPLFKKLKPITASRVPNKPVKADATGNGDKSNQGESMKLEEIRDKEVADLTEEEKTFLSEHKAELTDEERKTFGLEETDDEAAKAQADKEAADKAAADQAEADAKAAADKEEADRIEASKKGGVSISADRLAKLEADAQAGREARQELDRKKAEDFIGAAIHAGQIKSGEKDNTVEMLLGLKADARTKVETFIKGLPVNASLGKEEGDQGLEASTDAHDELHQKVTEAIKASAKEGKVLQYSQARKDILAADASLKNRIKEEEEAK